MLSRHTALRRVVVYSPFAMVMVLAGLSSLYFHELRDTRIQAGREREAHLATEEVISDLKDAETGQRGFLLIGDEAYLKPYSDGLRALAEDTARLRRLLAGNALQEARFDSLKTMVAHRLAIIDSSIAFRRAGNVAAATAVVRSGRGRVVMDEIRAVSERMAGEERAHLRAMLDREQSGALLLVLVFVGGLLLTAVITYAVNRTILRYIHDREQWGAELAAQNVQLQNDAAELEAQQSELEAQQSELELQNEELQTTNEDLVIARAEADKANAAKSTFLAAMSHELRTPLNAIAGYTDLFEAGVYGEITERQLDAIRRIHLNETQLLSVINQILNYTGLRARSAPIELEPIDVVSLLESVDAIVRPQIEAKGLACTLVCERGRDHVAHAHADRLRQVIINLVTNAIKFTPPGGLIVIKCTSDGAFVRIAVQDTGIGIPAGEQELIFEPFMQVQRGGVPGDGTGVGLGLAISRELVTSMGGEISVASEVDAGCTFTVLLPKAPSLGITVPGT